MSDVLKQKIEHILNSSQEPLETKEIEQLVTKLVTTETVTRTKVFYRLNILRGEGLIKGKFTGPGKGVWIWWRCNAFSIKKEKHDG